MVCFAFHYFHMLCNVHEHGWPQLGFHSGPSLSLYFSWLIMQDVAKLNLVLLYMGMASLTAQDLILFISCLYWIDYWNKWKGQKVRP